MSDKKQIEEMTKLLNRCAAECEEGCICSEKEHAEALYNAGYRKQSEWISVDERLPEETCECLITSKLGVVFLTFYSYRHRSFNATDDDDGDRWKFYDVTHWMPLPEPPKGE